MSEGRHCAGTAAWGRPDFPSIRAEDEGTAMAAVDEAMADWGELDLSSLHLQKQ